MKNILQHELSQNRNVAIFAAHRTTFSIVKQYLNSLHCKELPHKSLEEYTGELPLYKRQRLLLELPTKPGPWILLITKKVGSEGTNVTAAQAAILLDLDYNPAVDIQAQK